jgi:hypothetical protein
MKGPSELKCWLRAAKVGDRRERITVRRVVTLNERRPPPLAPEAFRSKSPVRPAGLFLSMSPFMSLAGTIGTAATLRRWLINL